MNGRRKAVCVCRKGRKKPKLTGQILIGLGEQQRLVLGCWARSSPDSSPSSPQVLIGSWV